MLQWKKNVSFKADVLGSSTHQSNFATILRMFHHDWYYGEKWSSWENKRAVPWKVFPKLSLQSEICKPVLFNNWFIDLKKVMIAPLFFELPSLWWFTLWHLRNIFSNSMTKKFLFVIFAINSTDFLKKFNSCWKSFHEIASPENILSPFSTISWKYIWWFTT